MASSTSRSTRTKSRRKRASDASKREVNPWRDHWVLLAVPKPFAKTIRRWRRFWRHTLFRLRLLLWLVIAVIALYALVR